jgi:hypothetical protein
VAFVGAERFTKNVSFGSNLVSPVTFTVTVFEVSNGMKVRSVGGIAV